MKPTKEQQDIINTFGKERLLKINATAGSGKSSTLRMLANQTPLPSLYLCFNRVVADDAKASFPPHVDCRTAHSLAYSTHGRPLQHKMTRPKHGYRNVAVTSSEIVKYYKVKDVPYKTVDGEDSSIPAVGVASIVRTTLSRWQNSWDSTLTFKHIPKQDLRDLFKDCKDVDKLFDKMLTGVLQLATKYWMDRVSPNSPVLAGFDTYLKLWQLSKPILPYDVIYVDECQDLSPVMLDVLRNQNCKIVYVGDSRQSIYQFRGAIDAMKRIECKQLNLSKSFRYGDEIAKIANWLLQGEMIVTGNENIDSVVCDVTSDKYTMIFRTNGALLEQAVKLVESGVSVYCEIDVKDFIKKLEACENLYNGDVVKHEDIVPYKNWKEFKEAAEDDIELKRFCTLVEKRRTYFFVKYLTQLQTKKNGDVILTTAHKSKGSEWEHVIIADDFPIKPDMEENKNEQEVNLFYVACTRAIKTLQLPKGMEY